MQRGLYKLIIPVIILAALGGCSTLESLELQKQEKPDVLLRAGKVYEECLPLIPPQVLDYSFSASKPVEFNIHYHSDKVVYPVKGQAVSTWQGIFDPTSIQDFSIEQPPFFCLMWTNPQDEEVGLNFEFTVRDKE